MKKIYKTKKITIKLPVKNVFHHLLVYLIGLVIMESFFLNSRVSCYDTQFLLDQFKCYSDPKGKISRLVKSGKLIRIKQGLYIPGEAYRFFPIDRISLANLIYGPSYISNLYALSLHGIIPEKVETVTSMTTKKNKFFSTPVGVFEYQYLRYSRYSVCVEVKTGAKNIRYLIATPEKALADTIAKESDLTSVKRLKEYLFDNLRVDDEDFSELQLNRFQEIASKYQSPVINTLYHLAKEFIA